MGLGSLLLDAAERAAAERGRTALALEVRADNARAIAIYHRAGYALTGKRGEYYHDGMAALRFAKQLPKSQARRAPDASTGTRRR